MTRKKILILRSNPVSPDSRVERTAQVLSAAGHEVIVIGWDRNQNLSLHEEHGYGTLERIRIPAGFNVGIRQGHRVLQFWWYLFWQLLSREYDAVHACDFDTAVPALLAAFFRRKQRVFDIFDFYGGGGKVPGWLRPVIRQAERLMMRLAHRIIIVDQSRLTLIPASQQAKVVVIYNSPPDVSASTLKSPIPKTSKLRVVYAGQLNEGRFILEVATAVNFLPEAEFIIAGFGPEHWVTRLKAHIEPFRNVRWIGKLSFLESLGLESTADVLFALYDTAIPQNRTASSNKLFEAMMLVKPIIVNKGTSMDIVVSRYQSGYVVEKPSEAGLVTLFESLISDRTELERRGRAGREAYTEHFSWQIMEQRLADIYVK